MSIDLETTLFGVGILGLTGVIVGYDIYRAIKEENLIKKETKEYIDKNQLPDSYKSPLLSLREFENMKLE
jgi:hypothetical protein